MKVLVIGPSWLGDMVMAQALFRMLHQQGMIIDVLAPAWNFAVLQRMPEVNRAIEMPIDHGELKLRERYRIGKSLRSENYQQAFILPNSFKSAIIPWAAKIPKRTGWLREMRGVLLNDGRKLNKQQYPLMVQRYLALGHDNNAQWDKANFLKPKLKVERGAILAKLSNHGVVFDESRPVMALSPGAAYGDTKRWPAEYYAEIAKEKLSQNWQVWLFGSPKDAEVTATIQGLTDNRCVDFAGKLQLHETVDFISLTSLMASNDSGLLHVAAALDVPILAFYGSTSPDFTPPLSDKIRILSTDIDCRPCFKPTCRYGHLKCLKDITPEMAKGAMVELSE